MQGCRRFQRWSGGGGASLLTEGPSSFRVPSPFLSCSSYTQEFFSMHAALLSTWDDALWPTWFWKHQGGPTDSRREERLNKPWWLAGTKRR